jgi:hypothetical protein
MHNFLEAWSPRMLGTLRVAISLILPGHASGIVCGLLMLAALIQTGSYSALMPASLTTLLQRAGSPSK